MIINNDIKVLNDDSDIKVAKFNNREQYEPLDGPLDVSIDGVDIQFRFL